MPVHTDVEKYRVKSTSNRHLDYVKVEVYSRIEPTLNPNIADNNRVFGTAETEPVISLTHHLWNCDASSEVVYIAGARNIAPTPRLTPTTYSLFC